MEVFTVTAQERVIQKIISMTEEQLDRIHNLMTRFNWDTQAALEYLQNGGKV